MADIAGFPMVTVVLDEPLGPGRETARRPISTDPVTKRAVLKPPKAVESAVPAAHRELCESILQAMGKVPEAPAVLLLVATHTSSYLDEAARLVANAFADHQDNPVALADVSADSAIARKLGVEPRNTIEAIADGGIDVTQAVVQSACPGLCLVTSGGATISDDTVTRLLERMQNAFDLVIMYGGPVESERPSALVRHAGGCVLLVGQSLSKRRALAARDRLQSQGRGSLLGFVMATAE